MNPIARYIEQLERELRLQRVPRGGRVLAEAADHLRASADEIRKSGVDAADAEDEAVARFGSAASIARHFAHAVASTSAKTALAWATAAFASYAIAAAFFILAAPSWLRDFPQGAPSMLALQIAAVALVLSALRALRYRHTLIDESRLRLVTNGIVIATAVLGVGGGLELLLAVVRPAPAPWSQAADVIAIYVFAATGALLATLVAVAAGARASVLRALPRRHGTDLPPEGAALIDDVAATVPPLRPLAAIVVARPGLACAATAATAFAIMTAVGLSDGAEVSGILGAAATGAFEATAVVVAYLALARALGLRAVSRGT